MPRICQTQNEMQMTGSRLSDASREKGVAVFIFEMQNEIYLDEWNAHLFMGIYMNFNEKLQGEVTLGRRRRFFYKHRATVCYFPQPLFSPVPRI